MAALRARAHGAVARHSLRGASIGVGSSTVPEYVMDQPLAIKSIDEGDFNKQEIKKLPVRYEMTISSNIDAAALPAILLALGEINGRTTIFRTPVAHRSGRGFLTDVSERSHHTPLSGSFPPHAGARRYTMALNVDFESLSTRRRGEYFLSRGIR